MKNETWKKKYPKYFVPSDTSLEISSDPFGIWKVISPYHVTYKGCSEFHNLYNTDFQEHHLTLGKNKGQFKQIPHSEAALLL